jgi:hypothetical protein
MDPVEYERSRHFFDPPIPRDFRNRDFDDQLQWAVENYFPSVSRWIADWVDAADNGRADFTISFTEFGQIVRDEKGFLAGFCAQNGIPVNERNQMFDHPKKEDKRNFRRGSTDEWRRIFSQSQRTFMRERMADSLFDKFSWDRARV